MYVPFTLNLLRAVRDSSGIFSIIHELQIQVLKYDGGPIKIDESNKTINIVRKERFFEKSDGQSEPVDESVADTYELNASANFKITIKPKEEHLHLSVYVYYQDELICSDSFYKSSPTKADLLARILTVKYEISD